MELTGVGVLRKVAYDEFGLYWRERAFSHVIRSNSRLKHYIVIGSIGYLGKVTVSYMSSVWCMVHWTEDLSI